jgi:sugar-specific transcriptional regulator TrmB
MEDALKDLGMSQHEATVYVALIKQGSVLASRIADETKINRSLVYTILDNLIEKGLVSYAIRENRKYFQAAEPEKFLDILKEKELKIKEQENKIKELLPKLKQLQLPIWEQKVEIYKGKEGLKTIFEDILRAENDYLAYGSGGVIETVLKFYFPNFIRRRAKLGMKVKLILNESTREKEFMKFPLTELKYLPNEYHSPCDTIIYGNKVAILFLLGGPMGLLIESKDFVKGYKNHFKLLWNTAKK